MKKDKKILFDGLADIKEAQQEEKEIEEEMDRLQNKHPEMSEDELFSLALENLLIKWEDETVKNDKKAAATYYERMKKLEDQEFIERILDKIKD